MRALSSEPEFQTNSGLRRLWLPRQKRLLPINPSLKEVLNGKGGEGDGTSLQPELGIFGRSNPPVSAPDARSDASSLSRPVTEARDAAGGATGACCACAALPRARRCGRPWRPRRRRAASRNEAWTLRRLWRRPARAGPLPCRCSIQSRRRRHPDGLCARGPPLAARPRLIPRRASRPRAAR